MIHEMTYNYTVGQKFTYLKPQGQDNSIGNDPVKLTQPTQHASRWRMRQGRGGQFDGVKYRYAGR